MSPPLLMSRVTHRDEEKLGVIVGLEVVRHKVLVVVKVSVARHTGPAAFFSFCRGLARAQPAAVASGVTLGGHVALACDRPSHGQTQGVGRGALGYAGHGDLASALAGRGGAGRARVVLLHKLVHIFGGLCRMKRDGEKNVVPRGLEKTGAQMARRRLTSAMWPAALPR